MAMTANLTLDTPMDADAAADRLANDDRGNSIIAAQSRPEYSSELSGAVRMRQVALVRTLIGNGVGGRFVPPSGFTALHKAVFDAYWGATPERFAVFTELVRHLRPFINNATKTELYTPLMLAARNCTSEQIELLLRMGADVTKRDYKGRRAQDWAEKRLALGEGEARIDIYASAVASVRQRVSVGSNRRSI